MPTRCDCSQSALIEWQSEPICSSKRVLLLTSCAAYLSLNASTLGSNNVENDHADGIGCRCWILSRYSTSVEHWLASSSRLCRLVGVHKLCCRYDLHGASGECSARAVSLDSSDFPSSVISFRWRHFLCNFYRARHRPGSPDWYRDFFSAGGWTDDRRAYL